MIPVLSHIEEHFGENFWFTTDGACGLGFFISPCDLETSDVEDYQNRLIKVLRQIDSRVLVRVEKRVSISNEIESTLPRKKAIIELGYSKKEYLVFLDYVGGIDVLGNLKKIFSASKALLSVEVGALLSTKALFEQFGFKTSGFEQDFILSIFDKGFSDWIRSERSVATGSENIGIVRLLKQPIENFNAESFSLIIDRIEKPYSVHVSFKRLDQAEAKLLLERRLKQTKTGKDISSIKSSHETEELILEGFQSGTQIFQMEVLISIRRDSMEILSKSLNQCASVLSLFSECMIETYGVAPSYIATKQGSLQHVPLLETDKALSGFLPLYGFDSIDKVVAKRALSLFRQDGSLYNFDLFSSSFEVSNTLVIGTSGKGKSVLTGLLSTSLLNDSKVSMIKLDVGGSHSKECELLGGIEYKLSLDRPSGINPFSIIKNERASENEKISIVSKFLGVLIQEQGELILSKALRSSIEESVREYIDENPSEPTLHNFFELALDFPRRDLLKRWVKGGIYEMAFASKGLEPRGLGLDREQRGGAEPTSSFKIAQERLRYFNFSEIFQAADPEFAQAGVAAVLAQFNVEMISARDQKIVLVCDEVPFFIKSCFDFFKFTTANVRKYGHAVVLISQLSTDFIVNGDTGIIENSPQRFIFSQDGDANSFAERFSLSDKDIAKIESLNSIPGKYSEVMLQSGGVTRKLTIKVTPEEYWRLTTTKADKDKLQELLKAVPGLTLRQAIACLSV